MSPELAATAATQGLTKGMNHYRTLRGTRMQVIMSMVRTSLPGSLRLVPHTPSPSMRFS